MNSENFMNNSDQPFNDNASDAWEEWRKSSEIIDNSINDNNPANNVESPTSATSAEDASEKEANKETIQERGEKGLLSERVAATIEKAKKSPAFKRCCAVVLAAALLGGIGLGTSLHRSGALNGNNNNQSGMNNEQNTYSIQAETETPERVYGENEGELANGVYYNYQEYADLNNKITDVAFGYDKTNLYQDKDATIDGIMEMAKKGPEYLSSYTYNTFTDEEKAELGIGGWSMTALDQYLSNAENLDGGEKQKAIESKLEEILRDDSTTYKFYEENGYEDSNYIVFTDIDQNGLMTPDELNLGYSKVKRNGAKQVDICRTIEINGKIMTIKVLDLNMECGFQPNYTNQETPPDLPEIKTGESEVQPTPDPIIPPTPIPPAPEIPDVKPIPDDGGSKKLTPKDPQLQIDNAGERASIESAGELTNDPAEEMRLQQEEAAKKAAEEEAAKKAAEEEQARKEAEAKEEAEKRREEWDSMDDYEKIVWANGVADEAIKRAQEAEAEANAAEAAAKDTAKDEQAANANDISESIAAAAAAEDAQKAADAAAEAAESAAPEGGESANERANLSF